MITLYILISVLIVSLISLLGVIGLSLKESVIKKISLTLVSFAVGALFGDAFIHLLPEAFETIENPLIVSLLITVGILLFFILEKFLRWRHCHVPETEKHYHPVVTMNLIGDGVHNLIDGMIIAASFLVSIPIGITTTLAVIFHEIPQEIGDFGVLVHGGMPVKKVLLFNLVSAICAVIGAVLILLVGQLGNFSIYLLPITAGGFIYIAGSDLVPELHHETRARNSAMQLLLIVFGIGIMAGLLLLE